VQLRWLLTGAEGMLGTDAAEVLRAHATVTTVGRSSLDLTDPTDVRDAVAGHDVVLNCAAWTAVDDAEAHEAQAFAVNAVAPALLARAARECSARMVHISTDYVFDGRARQPYGEDAAVAPASAYGRTKAAGEWAVRAELPHAHLVVRTAWLYGAHGRCFPKTIARAARERGQVSVVDDQHGQPTWTRDVADLVLRLVEAGAPAGTYHATSSGATSWFGFAREVVTAAGLEPSVVSATDSASFPRPAPRPSYSVLGHERLHAVGVAPIGDWQQRWEQASSVVLPALE
jgi:dTDP-4-dehydrorhamnose reductase